MHNECALGECVKLRKKTSKTAKSLQTLDENSKFSISLLLYPRLIGKKR
jgi:hypothetical protein